MEILGFVRVGRQLCFYFLNCNTDFRVVGLYPGMEKCDQNFLSLLLVISPCFTLKISSSWCFHLPVTVHRTLPWTISIRSSFCIYIRTSFADLWKCKNVWSFVHLISTCDPCICSCTYRNYACKQPEAEPVIWQWCKIGVTGHSNYALRCTICPIQVWDNFFSFSSPL